MREILKNLTIVFSLVVASIFIYVGIYILGLEVAKYLERPYGFCHLHGGEVIVIKNLNDTDSYYCVMGHEYPLQMYRYAPCIKCKPEWRFRE